MKLMLRFVALSCVLASVGLTYAQDLSQKITYKTTAVPIKRALKEIDKIAKVGLDAATPILNEIVVIDVKDAPLDDLLKRLAAVTSCRWRKIDGVMMLERTSEIAQKEEATEQKLKAEAIKKAVAKMMGSVEKNPVLDAKLADEMAANQKSTKVADIVGANGAEAVAQSAKSMLLDGSEQPTGRAIARLLSGINLGLLAKLKDDDRIVFATRPNRVQLGLGPNSIAILNQFVLEQNVWSEAMTRRNNAQSSGKSEADRAFEMVMGRSEQPIKGVADKALLCVEYRAMLDSYEVQLKIYDNKGMSLFQGSQNIAMDTSLLNALDSMMQPDKTKDPEIELSKDSQEILEFFRGLTGGIFGATKAKDMSAEVFAKINKPNEYDPLSFIHSEALMATSKARGEQLVACIPDSIFRASKFMMPGQKLTVNNFLKQLTDQEIVVVREQDGWMEVMSSRPAQDRTKRLNREALTKLIRASNAKGYASLDDMSAYALSNEPLQDSELAQIYALVVLPGSMNITSGMASWDMLRLYGLLGQNQKQVLSRGDAIAFRSLSPTQFELVRRMAFRPSGFRGGLTVSVEGDTPTFAGNNYRSEPTELMPNGLPVDGSVTLKVKTDKVVKDAGPNKPRLNLFGSFSADELAAIKMVRDDPMAGGIIGNLLPELKKFQLGSRLSLNFVFHLTPEVSFNQELTDITFNANSPVVDMNGLPSDFKKKYDDMAAQMAKSGGFGNIFGGGGKINP